MVTAISRDMRAVQSQVLPQLNPPVTDAEVYELSDEIAKAFARFPYPDSFFSWTGDLDDHGSLNVFNRADRPPSWRKASSSDRVSDNPAAGSCRAEADDGIAAQAGIDSGPLYFV
jgi:hypothetical protein